MTRQAGRPKQENEVSLRDILSNPAKRRTFIQSVERLVESKRGLQTNSELHNEDVGSTAEAYGLGKGFVSAIVNSVAKDDVESAIEVLSDKVSVLELFQ